MKKTVFKILCLIFPFMLSAFDQTVFVTKQDRDTIKNIQTNVEYHVTNQNVHILGPNKTHLDNALTNNQLEFSAAGNIRFQNDKIYSGADPSRATIQFWGKSYFISTVLCGMFGGNADYASLIAYGATSGSADLYQGFSQRSGALGFRVLHDTSIVTSNNLYVAKNFSLGPTIQNARLQFYSDGTNSFQIDSNGTTGKVLTSSNGGITNGMDVAKLGDVTITNDYFLMGVSAPQPTTGFGGLQDNHFVIRAPGGVNSGLMLASESPFIQFADRNLNALGDFGFFNSDIYFINRRIGKLHFGHQGREDEILIGETGDVTMLGSLTVSGTNTALAVSSTSGDLLLGGVNYGPRIVNSITNNQNNVTLGGMTLNNDMISGYYASFTYSMGLGNLSSIQFREANGNDMIFSGYSSDWQHNFDRMILRANGGAIFPTGHVSTVLGGTITNQLVGSPVGSNQVSYLWKGSNTEFQAISETESNTVYIVSDDQTVFDTKGIYNKHEIYNSLVNPLETEIVLLEDKAAYTVNIDTNCVISFNAEGLDFNGKETEFKLYLNIIETNIPPITFKAGITFARTPEYTVTGRYENIVSTSDGTNFLVRQTFPTIYEKEGWPEVHSDYALPAWGQGTDNFYSYLQAPASSAKSCSVTLIKQQEGLVKVSLSYLWYCDNATTLTNVSGSTFVTFIDGNEVLWNNVQTNLVNLSAATYLRTNVVRVVDAGELFADNRLSYLFVMTLLNPTDASANYMNRLERVNSFYQRLNELEIRAYNAGKRDW